WCTQKTDSVDSAQTFLKKSVTTSIPNSQLFQVGLQQTQTMNSQKTSFLSLRYSPQDSMGKENIKRKSKKKEQLNESIAATPDNNTTKYTKVSRTIIFKPSSDLKTYLDKCFGTFRYFYNTGVKLINDTFREDMERFSYRRDKGLCCFELPLHKRKKNIVH